MVLKTVNDEVIDRVELFVRTELPTILISMKTRTDMSDADYYGEIYVHSPESFKFSIGDRILISELVNYVRTACEKSQLNAGLNHVEQPSNNRTSIHGDKNIIPITQNIRTTQTHYFLNKLLETANRNAQRPRGGYRYDDETKKFASYFRLIAGPLAYKTLTQNLPLALPALPSVNRYVHRSNCRVTECVPRYDELYQYLEERGHEKVVSLSEDGTRIIGRVQYDKYTNQLIGFVPPINKQTGLPIPFCYPARNAPEIVQHFTEGNSTSLLVNVIMAFPVSQNPPAPFCLLIYGTDNKYNANDVCNRWESIIRALNKLTIKVLSISSDSDPKYNSSMKQLSKLGNPSQKFDALNWFRCGDRDFNLFFTIYVQDTIHLANKLRNLLLKTIANVHKLPCGKFYIQQSHLKHLIELFTKDKHNLSPMVLNPVDKQNFESVVRISDGNVIALLRKHVIGSQATAKFLEIIRYIIDSYMDISLQPLERLYKIWYSVFFVRLWRKFIRSKKNLTLKNNFITTNTYNCIELNAHSMLLCIVQLREQNLKHLFLPNLMSSQPCESLFRQIRSFTTTYSTVANCSVKEILQRISKIQLQNDIVVSETVSNFVFPHLIRNNNKTKPTIYDLPTNNEILTEMQKVKRDVMNDAIALGIIKEKQTNNTNFACNLMPYTEKCKKKEQKDKQSESFHKHWRHEHIRFSSLGLQNYAHQFDEDEVDEFSSFVEVFRNDTINRRIIVRKTSLCWLLRSDHVRVSSDRLERVKTNSKKKINKKMNGTKYNTNKPMKKLH